MAEGRSSRPHNPSRSLSFESVSEITTETDSIPASTLTLRSRSFQRDPLRNHLHLLRPRNLHYTGPRRTISTSEGAASVLEAVDLRTLEYVSPVYENLICTICVAALVNPVQLPCEHIFCLECIGTHFQTISGDNKTCPKCRRRVNMIADVAQPPKIVREMLDDLVVKCPNSNCDAEMHRYTIQDHVNRYCEVTLVACPSGDCSKKIERKLVEHGCLHSYEQCGDCDEMVMKCDLESHQSITCEKAQMTCTFCPDTVPRTKLPYHLENECLAYEIACPGHTVGCTYRDFRLQVEEHARLCPMAIMAPHIEKQRTNHERRIDEQQSMLTRQAEQLAAMNRVQHKVSMLQDELEQMRKMFFNDDGTPRSLPSTSSHSLSDSSATDGELKDHLNRQDEVNAVHFSRIEELDARMQMHFTNENIRWQQEIMGLGSAVTAMRTQLNTLANVYLRQAPGGIGHDAVVAGGNASGSSLQRAEMNRPQSPRRGSSSSPHREDPKL